MLQPCLTAQECPLARPRPKALSQKPTRILPPLNSAVAAGSRGERLAPLLCLRKSEARSRARLRPSGGSVTAEVAILTRSCVALAADSALTVGDDRVYKSANKLFALSKAQPIAAMIFGNADYFSVPWETVIKTFRAQSSTEWSSVSAAASDLYAYLLRQQFQDLWDEADFAAAFGESVAEQVLAHLKSGDVALDTPEAVTLTIQFARAQRSQAEGIEGLWSVERYVGARPHVREGVDAYIDEHCSGFGVVASDQFKKAVLIAAMGMLFRAFPSRGMTGVVVAGFGSDQLFPELVEFHVDGVIGGDLRAWTERVCDINDPDAGAVFVIPFAVSNEVFLFMERIDGRYLPFVAQLMWRMLQDYGAELIDAVVPNVADRPAALNQAAQLIAGKIQAAMAGFSEVRRDYASQPIVDVLRSLPKEELAAIAEALVELTSLQRRVVGDLETVGGPVDVAVISKGDGLVWIRRKHYFDMAKNYDYVLRQLAAQMGKQNGEA